MLAFAVGAVVVVVGVAAGVGLGGLALTAWFSLVRGHRRA